MIGASRANGSHRPIRACWAHGPRGAIRCVADERAVSAPDRDRGARRVHPPTSPPPSASAAAARKRTRRPNGYYRGFAAAPPMPRGRTSGAGTSGGDDPRRAPPECAASLPSCGAEGARWRCRPRGHPPGARDLGQERSPQVRPRRAGSRHECHAPTTHRSPTTTGRPRRSDHARRLRRTRGRHLHRARFPTVAVARHGSRRPHTWSRRSPIPNQTETLPSPAASARSQPGELGEQAVDLLVAADRDAERVAQTLGREVSHQDAAGRGERPAPALGPRRGGGRARSWSPTAGPRNRARRAAP